MEPLPSERERVRGGIASLCLLLRTLHRSWQLWTTFHFRVFKWILEKISSNLEEISCVFRWLLLTLLRSQELNPQLYKKEKTSNYKAYRKHRRAARGYCPTHCPLQ